MLCLVVSMANICHDQFCRSRSPARRRYWACLLHHVIRRACAMKPELAFSIYCHKESLCDENCLFSRFCSSRFHEFSLTHDGLLLISIYVVWLLYLISCFLLFWCTLVFAQTCHEHNAWIVIAIYYSEMDASTFMLSVPPPAHCIIWFTW